MLEPSLLHQALEFRRARDWEQFHTPQNLAIAISVEAGELLEQFQWQLLPDNPISEARFDSIAQEIADVAILLSYLANDLGVNIDEAVKKKLALNEVRYPVDRVKGSAKKHSDY